MRDSRDGVLIDPDAQQVRSRFVRSVLVAAALLAILLLGASMRLTGVNWDEQTHLHPDERFLTDVETRLGWPANLAEYFDDARSPLNPYNRDVGMFVYGTLPIFIVKGLGLLLNMSAYWEIHLVGRVVSAIYDLIVVLLVFFIGRRLYGRWVGLLASLLMACTVLNIQHAHFFTVETFITLTITLAFFFTVRAAQEGRWRDWALTGLCLGMALAGKISMGLYLLVIGAAGLLWALQQREAPVAVGAGGSYVLLQRALRWMSFSVQLDGETEKARRNAALLRGLTKAALGLLLVLFMALVAFRVTQPYAFTGSSPFSLKLSDDWLDDMSTVSQMMNGTVDMPPSHQWTDREPVWYAWRNIVLWGMGLPLGLAAWLGWLVAAVELVRKRRLEHLLPLLWVTFSFLYLSIQFVKTIRYFLPIYPILAVLAAYFLAWLWRQGRRLAAEAAEHPSLWGRLAAPAAAGVGILVVVGTLLYAEAFTNIYRRPLSRVAASRWIYENIPAGSALTWEAWDDILPQNIDYKNADQTYRLVRTEPYWEDTPEKREAIFQWLDEADYIVFSSNRLYDSIPRLPERYPLTTAYYKYLFSGELGFKVIKVFTSYPNLGPIQLVDDKADETFTVYDHPKVTILQKTGDYSSARARALLGDIPIDHLLRMKPVDAMRSRHGLLLRLDEWRAQLQGGTWAAIFNPTDLANRVPVLAWLVLLELLALAAFPIAFVAFRPFRDRGFILAKVLGLLFVAYPAWLGASLHIVPYTWPVLASITLLLLALGGGLAWRRRAEICAFVHREGRYLLLEEGLYLAFFAAFLLVRWGNPDLWHPAMGGEKPMDLAYLNAIIKSTWFPPYDPWFAGGYINYYYFGQVIVATVIKLTGIVPTVAYNLAVPTLFALTAMGGYAVVSGLLGKEAEAAERPLFDRATCAGLLGALLIAVLGNLGQVRLFYDGFVQASQPDYSSSMPGLASALSGFRRVLAGQPLLFRPEWWYWNASRVMGAGEINEFPYFSFLYADLHAHLIALPFTLLALGLTASLLRMGAGGERPAVAKVAPLTGLWARLQHWAQGVGWSEWLALGLLALTLGELRVNNTWDYPTYLLVALAGLAFARFLRPEGTRWEQAWPVLGRFLLLVVASTLLFLPFHSRYGGAYASVELWRGTRTALGDYLIIYGLFLFTLVSYLLNRALGYRAHGALVRGLRLAFGPQAARYNRLAGLLAQPGPGYPLVWASSIAVLIFSAISLFNHWWLLGLVLPLTLLGVSLMLRRDLAPAERFAATLFTGGLWLTLAVEVIVLRGDIGRMNTVFKFYLQVWVLWGVAAAVALSSLASRWHRWPGALRVLWQAGLGLLLFGAALYPVTATYGKIRDRFDPAIGPALDGMAYTRTAVYYDEGQPLVLAHDMKAIRWLQENIAGSPVILEANTPLYRWGSRISIYTGLPTVIGWDWHEKQQRAVVPGEVVDWRLEDVRTLYEGTGVADTVRLLKLYDVSYVYVGELERAYYSPQGLAKFDTLRRFFETVYTDGPVTIYRVRKESLGGLSARPFLLPQAGGGDSKNLLLDGPVDGLPVVADRGWNPLANAGPLAATVVWWLALSILGWAAWPLCLGACRGLPDRGYLLAKAAGWLLVGYVVWLGACSRLLANRVAHIYAVLALLLLAGALAAYRQRRRMAALWRARRWLLWREELLFLAAFLAFVGIRLLNPDLWQPWFGGEKMMEFAYLNAILKSAHLPPYDPYFAGGYINYYYYGLYLVNLLVKLTGVVPEVAFNLAVPTFFALTVGQAFSLGHALTCGRRGRRWLWGGLAAVVGVALLANLTVLAQWLGSMVAIGGGRLDPESGLEVAAPFMAGIGRWISGQGALLPFDYWYQATRVIPFTINEFPFFSFLFADLHPHMMGMPFTLATLILVVGVFLRGHAHPARRTRRLEPTARNTFRRVIEAVWSLGLLALTAGALGPLNTWDLPTYLGLAALVMGWLALERGQGWRGLAQVVGVAAAACLFYLPFYMHYVAPPVSLRWLPNHTRLRFFLVVWGVWLAALYGWLAPRWWRGRRGAGRLWKQFTGPGRRRAHHLLAILARPAGPTLLRGLAGLAALLVAGIALVAGEAGVALLAPLIALGLDLWLRTDARPAERLAGLLAATGCLILAGIELVFLADFLAGGEWQRMNTFFKFGIQAWVLLAVAVAAGLPEILEWLAGRGSAGRRIAWSIAMVALLAISLTYVPLGVASRVTERFPGGPPPAGTLDGLAYMENGIYNWPDAAHPIILRYDYEAIRWLLAHVRGTPVIAEAPLPYYREGGMRVSSYTGLPTLLGAHQVEQRSPADVVRRDALAQALYASPDLNETLAILRELRVQYIYFGQLEENVFGAPARNKFNELVSHGELEVVYTNPRVTIYRFPQT